MLLNQTLKSAILKNKKQNNKKKNLTLYQVTQARDGGRGCQILNMFGR